MATKRTDEIELLPKAPIHRLLVPVKSFLEIEAVSGGLLLACTVVAIGIANSGWAASFEAFWHSHVNIAIGGYSLSGDLGHLIISDAFMTIFFFVVGLEVKREIVSGELRNPRKALLPIIGAIGGVLVPATIYSQFQAGQLGHRGWPIPMATDIAFVVGILALFRRQIPFGLKVFLLTLAIVDDLIAVLVIAMFFTESLSYGYLVIAAGGCAVTYLLNKLGVRSIMVYFLVGTIIWLTFHHAGIHTTIAGVILGLMTPSKAWIDKKSLIEIIKGHWQRLIADQTDDEKLPIDVEQLEFAARESLSPLHRLEMQLHPWVAFFIMPLFALANAGVLLELHALQDPITISVATALAIGKPLGIVSASYIAVRLGVSSMPEGVSWSMFIAGGFLCGIGFTMALFLTSLSFPGEEYAAMATAGKMGTLVGSIASAVVGGSLLLWSCRQHSSP